ncbi:MAG: beta-ketoacyl-ACP reductase [Bacteroidia bacterium]|nr:beta-ketoacyl-ACP reductase [Bacteroidia bacterium]
MNRLADRIAIITGGARGIGKATAQRFVQEGATAVIWDLMEEAGLSTVAELEAAGGKAWFMKVNTTDQAAVTRAAAEVHQRYGRIDILINNAGITRDASLLKMEQSQWQQVIDVNLSGVFYCTQAVAGYMAAQGYGRIVSAASVVGLYGNFGQSNYVATKAGLIGMTKVWARELGRKGITANAVAPGFIATEMIGTIPEKVISMVQERTPLGRFGKPEEIANAYLFLASDEASFINGATLSVDGGVVM